MRRRVGIVPLAGGSAGGPGAGLAKVRAQVLAPQPDAALVEVRRLGVTSALEEQVAQLRSRLDLTGIQQQSAPQLALGALRIASAGALGRLASERYRAGCDWK